MSEEKNIKRSDKEQGISDKLKENEQHFPEDSHAPDSVGSQQSSVHSQSQPQTTNDKLQTENMEVHKHPHHPTNKKKWEEYLLEFLMLFLAIFLGFVAENVRENAVEKHREKQYMQSLVSDLTLDTAMLNTGFPRREARIKAIDSIFMFFNSHKETKFLPGAV